MSPPPQPSNPFENTMGLAEKELYRQKKTHNNSTIHKNKGEKVPELKLLVQGLSVKVRGVKGPIADGELQKFKIREKDSLSD